MDINLLIEETRQNLINYINSSKLPIGVLYLILKQLFSQIEKMYYGQLNAAVIKENNQVQQKIKKEVPKQIEFTMEQQQEQGQDSSNQKE